MKAFFTLQFGKFVIWLMRLGLGWVKSVTPEYAITARKASKQKILNQKAKALETATELDDIAPIGAYNYMGFKTMQAAQKRLMDVYEIANVASGNEPSIGPMGSVKVVVRDVIRILDE